MPLPDAPRVIYKKNPLVEVVCQVRFSPILKIDANVPADFQDRIRSEYPDLSQVNLSLEQPNAPALPPAEKQLLESAVNKNYAFVSEDRKWRVNLTRNYMSLSTGAYLRWEEFKDRFRSPLQALSDIYAPRNFSRIGLRYIDILYRSKLNLVDVGWGELLRPHLLGLMSSPDVKDDIDAFDSLYAVRLGDQASKCRLAARTVISQESGEQCFMIDGDFFTAGTIAMPDVTTHMDYLHSHASRLIQWCITPRLHEAMEPQSVL